MVVGLVMERPPLPFAAIVVEWNDLDQLGLLRADSREICRRDIGSQSTAP